MTANRRRGFTLIEVVITMAIVALLAAIAIPSYRKHIQKSNRAVAKTVLTQIISREESFFADRKAYATTLAALGYPVDGGGITYIDRDGAPQSTNTTNRIYSIAICATGTGGCVNASGTLVWFIATPIHVQNDPVESCGSLTISTGGDKGQVGGTVSNCWKL